MRKFSIVIDNKIVFGPREYKYNHFYQFFKNNNLNTNLLPFDKTDDNVIITSSFKMLPTFTETKPNINSIYEEYVGPTYQILENEVIITYTKQFKSVDSIKASLKVEIADVRYKKEIDNIELNIQNTDIIIEADRLNKMMIIQIYGIMADTDIYNFKFPKSQNWLPITKPQMGTIVQAFITQTQNAFDYEKTIIDSIDSSTTVNQLKLIRKNEIIKDDIMLQYQDIIE